MTVAERETGQIVGAGIVAPNQRDFAALEGVLHDWLRRRLGDVSDLRTHGFTYPRGAGLSHETILFDAEWTDAGASRRQGMVLRIKPVDHTVYQVDQFEQQYRIMEALHRADATPVARPLWLETDADILGAPFFVMEKQVGRVPVSFPPYSREGWVTDLDTRQRHTLWENAVRALAGIQSLPLEQARFLDPENRHPDGFEQEWDRWRAYYDWARDGEDFPFLEDVWSRLARSRPAARAPGLVWGDARIGNMMFADDMRVVAVMDWEAPGIGGALHDLGYWTVMARIETEQQGVARLDGMGSREETIALWRELTGIATDDIEWYELFAMWKLSCLAIRTLALIGHERPGMNRFDNPATRVMAATCGVPRPAPTDADPRSSRQAAPR
jgi:aminoglycoside phosphotransferase (APT) family kinase protein